MIAPTSGCRSNAAHPNRPAHPAYNTSVGILLDTTTLPLELGLPVCDLIPQVTVVSALVLDMDVLKEHRPEEEYIGKQTQCQIERQLRFHASDPSCGGRGREPFVLTL